MQVRVLVDEYDKKSEELLEKYVKKHRKDIEWAEGFLEKCPNPPEGSLLVLEHSVEHVGHIPYVEISEELVIKSTKNSSGAITHEVWARSYDLYRSELSETRVAEIEL